MKYLIIPIFISLITLLSACKKEGFYQGDHFFVKNAGAEMPVYVKGNIQSGTFILFLHGGPGGNASLPSFMPVSKSSKTITPLLTGISGDRAFQWEILIQARLLLSNLWMTWI